ncbi:MAG: hypothetical protein JNK43_03930 [Ignavibacteria bacterium]|nr:hypothetical protein [Ignavibacteria bacterium]
MNNTSLIQLLKSFSKDEIERFGSFVNSEYFNRKSAVTKLWNELYPFQPEFDSPQMTREYIYTRVFPENDFNYGTLKNLVYELTMLAKKFIELEHYSAKKTECNFNLLEALMERRAQAFIEKTFAQTGRMIEESFNETGYYGNRFRLSSLKQSHLIQQDKYYDTAKSSAEANTDLTMGYFIDVFHNNYNRLLMRTELDSGPQETFMKSVLEFYNTVPVEFDFRVRIFYHAIMLIYDGSRSHFYEMRKLVEENAANLSRGEKYNFLVALSGYCYVRFEEGNAEFLQEEFGIYRYMVDSGIHSFGPTLNIDGSFYRNTALSALKNNEPDWALQFMKKFRYQLNPAVREHYWLHTLIEYNIRTKQFEQALKHLPRIKHSILIDKIQIKKWELIVNYEMQRFSSLPYIIDSAKHFIYNDDKLNPLKKERLNGFIQLVARLLTLRLKKESGEDITPDIYLLKKETDNLKDGGKFWLYEKLNEMEK